MTLCCETLVYSTGNQMHPSMSSGCKDQTEHSQSSQSQVLRTQNQMEGKTSYSSHIGGAQQSLPKQRQVWRKLLSYQSVCGASLDSKYMKGLCLMFFPKVLPSYDKWHIRYRQRKTVTILGRKVSIKIESAYLPNIRVARSPRTSSIDIFSCQSKFRMREKGLSWLFLPSPAGRIREADVWRSCYLLLAFARGSRISQLWQPGVGKGESGPSQYPANYANYWGGMNPPSHPSWVLLADLIIKLTWDRLTGGKEI